MNFSELGLSDTLIDAIGYMGFSQPTPIQEQAIPQILQGRDLVACAQTGTGKTAAFILPIIERLSKRENIRGINTVVIVPTRELAVQIDQQIHGFTYFSSFGSTSIYGGGDGDNWDDQKRALTSGVEIVVCTPGKFIAHLNMGYVDLSNVEHVILDEADRMLDIGFHDDILRIFSYMPKARQTLLFSATMPNKIRDLADRILKEPAEISIAISKPAEGVTQQVYLCNDQHKNTLVRHLITTHPECTSILVFSSTKREVIEIVRALRNKEYMVEGISSDLEQQERENVLIRFRSRQCRALVATDVLSRGIDIKDINLVINYHVPGDAEDYVHRVGRTARAATKGLAITLVNEEDMYKFLRIERLIEREIEKLEIPREIGQSPAWNPMGAGGKSKGGSQGHRRKSGQHRGKGKPQGSRPQGAGNNQQRHRGPDRHGPRKPPANS